MVNRPDIKQWAKEFQGQIMAFEQNTADFEPKNLRELFELYFNTKACQILFNKLHECYNQQFYFCDLTLV